MMKRQQRRQQRHTLTTIQYSVFHQSKNPDSGETNKPLSSPDDIFSPSPPTLPTFILSRSRGTREHVSAIDPFAVSVDIKLPVCAAHSPGPFYQASCLLHIRGTVLGEGVRLVVRLMHG